MNYWYKKIIGIIGFLIAFSYVIYFLVKSEVLLHLLTVLIVLFLVLVLPQLEKRVLILNLTMLLAILYMLKDSSVNNSFLTMGIRSNLPLFSIIVITPLLGILISTGDYIQALKQKTNKIWNNMYLFYWWMTFSTHGLGVLLNVGSITINHQLMDVANIHNKKIVGSILNRAFITTMFWSPYFAAMALVLTNLNLQWTDVGWQALLFTFIVLVGNFFINYKDLKDEQTLKNNILNTDININDLESSKKVGELLFVLGSMVTITFFLNSLFLHSMVISICIVALIYPMVWCSIKQKFILYKAAFKSHLFIVIPNMKQELSLYLIAGLFGTVFIHSIWKDKLLEFLIGNFGDYPIAFILVVILFIMGFALISIPPIVTVTLLSTSVDPVLFGMSIEIFALTLLFSWGAVTSIAPTTSVSSILSARLNIPITTVSLKWNLKFFLMLIFLIPIYLSLFL
ncbi:hypothetical protein NYE67_15890 [Solibacillus sp. FSL W8-0474]|uniref:hypothetical protein n=1 Tax=Solibacillus sp. FSL W8-0474 TaxID=2975336 RepID=UPI0030F67BB6